MSTLLIMLSTSLQKVPKAMLTCCFPPIQLNSKSFISNTNPHIGGCVGYLWHAQETAVRATAVGSNGRGGWRGSNGRHKRGEGRVMGRKQCNCDSKFSMEKDSQTGKLFPNLLEFHSLANLRIGN